MRLARSRVLEYRKVTVAGIRPRALVDAQVERAVRQVHRKKQRMDALALLGRHVLGIRIKTDPAARYAAGRIAYAHHGTMARAGEEFHDGHVAAVLDRGRRRRERRAYGNQPKTKRSHKFPHVSLHQMSRYREVRSPPPASGVKPVHS